MESVHAAISEGVESFGKSFLADSPNLPRSSALRFVSDSQEKAADAWMSGPNPNLSPRDTTFVLPPR